MVTVSLWFPWSESVSGTISAICALASVVCTIFGFWLVNDQLKQGRQATANAAASTIYQLSHSVYRLFIDQPDLRPYFYDDKKMAADSPDRSQILAAAELLCDFFEHIVHAGGVFDKPLKDVWLSYMRWMYKNSTVLHDFVNDMKGQYTAEFYGAITSSADAA